MLYLKLWLEEKRHSLRLFLGFCFLAITDGNNSRQDQQSISLVVASSISSNRVQVPFGL